MNLLRDEFTELSPHAYLSRAGKIFVKFDGSTQDSGNVSFGIDVKGERFFVKTAGENDDPRPFVPHSARIELLRNAVRLASGCSHAVLPPLLNTVESPVGPMIIYDWVDGELLGGSQAHRNSSISAHQRFRALETNVICDALEPVFTLHKMLAEQGWVAVDFYDGSLIYDFVNQKMSVVDLDSYHDGPFINDMGRLFGSERYMAPEEFKLGATIDERTTVFTLGRLVSIFLSNGTLDPVAFRAAQEIGDVMTRACAPEPDQRFPSVRTFLQAWLTARRFEPPSSSGRLQNRT